MIRIPNRELVGVKKLKVDKDNPNVMSKAQREALARNIRKYGFIVPVVTNKHYVIADGQQRWEVAKDVLKMESVPVIRLPLKDIDRRILRQVLNKLRGEHDRQLDAEDYRRIAGMSAEGIAELAAAIATDRTAIERAMEERPPDEPEYDENIETKNRCPKCGYEW